jgi:hypothetical protein
MKKGAVVVPAVGMCKASLRCLCEVLLSDICTKSVSDNINAAISRLAIVRANRTVLTDLIAEVVVDLAALSQSKLDVFLSALLAVKKRKGADREASAKTIGKKAVSLHLKHAFMAPNRTSTCSLIHPFSFYFSRPYTHPNLQILISSYSYMILSLPFSQPRIVPLPTSCP